MIFNEWPKVNNYETMLIVTSWRIIWCKILLRLYNFKISWSKLKWPNSISVQKVWIFSEIWLLFGGLALGWSQGAMRDEFLWYSIIRCKRDVCQATDMFFRCCEDANNFKNIFFLFGGKNHQWITFDSICASNWPFWLKNVDFNPQNGQNYFWNYLHLYGTEKPYH